MVDMSNPRGSRSVRISDDERGGWSSDRPRRDGAPSRPPNISVRGRVLSPTDHLRYSPASLLVIVSSSAVERDSFAERLIEDRSSVLSLDKVRRLLAGRVGAHEVEARAAELLDAAVLNRIKAGEAVVLAAEGLGADGRERFVRMAAAARRRRHLILVETGRDQVAEEDRAELNELRRALDAGEMGAEGFDTALRLSGASVSEVKAITFRPAPRDD
jgi:predicted kinase